ncbi:unnamed protein product [Rhodiola kirilowii]
MRLVELYRPLLVFRGSVNLMTSNTEKLRFGGKVQLRRGGGFLL